MPSIRITSVLAMVSLLVGCSSNDGAPASSGQGGAANAQGGQRASDAGAGSSSANQGTSSGVGGTSSATSATNSTSSSGGSSTNASGGAATGAAPSAGGSSALNNNGGSANTNASGTSGTPRGGAKATGGSATTARAGAPSTGGATSASTASGTPAAGTAPGCGKTGAATGVQNLTLPIAGTDREYVLFVPTTYDPSKALPLVFAWHGLGGTGTLARQYFGLEKAASNQAIFVYPSGLLNSDGKAAWTLTQDGIDLQFFDALLADVTDKYCVDRTRVFSTGHSYGAMMTNTLGCFRGNVLRGIAPVAGMPPFGRATCTGAVAAWIAHGDNDATVDFTTGGIASRDFWIKADSCSATTDPVAVDPSPCVAYQGCSDGHPVHWCVHQSNHNWPSFAAAGIWSFFNALK